MALSFYKLFTSTKNRDWVYSQCCANSGLNLPRNNFEQSFTRYADEIYTSTYNGYRILIEGQKLLDEVHNSNWEFIDYYVNEWASQSTVLTNISDGQAIQSKRRTGETTDQILDRWKYGTRQYGMRDDHRLVESSPAEGCVVPSIDCYDESEGGNYAEELLLKTTARWNSTDRTVGTPGFGRQGEESDKRLLNIRTERVNKVPARLIAHTRRFYDRQSAGESMYEERDYQTRGYDMSELRNRTDRINSNRRI